MKRVFILSVALLPLIFGAKTKKSPPVEYASELHYQRPFTQSLPLTGQVQVNFRPQEQADSEPKVDPYEEFLQRRREILAQEPPGSRRKYEFTFEELRELSKTGRYHKLPLDPGFVLQQDPSDYLALAIEVHDPEAIAFSEKFVELDHTSSYLQSTLIDLILREDTVILEQLGSTFPTIFTNIFVFYEPFTHLSGNSLIRIAVDQGKSRAAISMFKSVPISVIGDFWQTINFMKSFLIDAMEAREIRLKAREGESKLPPSVLKDIYYTCVAVGNLKALEYLCESIDVDLLTMFEEGEDGMAFSAMFLAAHTGYHEIVQFLGEKCYELYTLETSTGMLPVHVAASNGHIEVLKVMDKHAPDTMMAEVNVNGIMQTPFSIAIRNKKRHIADIILSFIENPAWIKFEMGNLAVWAIHDDNPSLLEMYFEYGLGGFDGHIQGYQHSLLEMAVLGSVDPEKFKSSRCKVKCLDFLIRFWRRMRLPFKVNHGNVRGNILGLVKPIDIDAFLALVRDGGVDPNALIFECVTDEKDQVISISATTFLNRIISQGATELVPIAVRHGADPRIVDDAGNETIAVAQEHNNKFALDYLLSL